jgi:GxxExxY protein
MQPEDINSYFDFEEEPSLELRELTNRIIGCAIRVHCALGPGYLESYYERALAIAFRKAGIEFQRQHPFQVLYEGESVGEGKLDFLVEGTIVVELKHVEAIGSVHVAQCISYLKATNRRLCLILNFNVALLKDGIRRVAR